MNSHKIPSCLHSAILLIGICSCDLGESHESLEERAGETGREFGSDDPRTEASADLLQADFDGDGYADLAIGVPSEEVDGKDAGAVNVIYGSDDGLDSDSDEVWNRNKSGVKETP